jgi:peptide/nickel transport system permease protein
VSRYLLDRLFQVVPLLFGITLISFFLVHLAPGDPVALLYGPDVSPEEVIRIHADWGLDRPIVVQYFMWSWRFLQGDFGRSYVDGRPALAVILERVPRTLELTLTALAFANLAGMLIGTLSAVRRGSAFDRVSSLVATTCYSIPNFWFALLLILLFAVQLRWLPTAGTSSLRGQPSLLDQLQHLVLPAFVMSLRELGRMVRFTRSSILEALSQDYIRTAHAKGARPRQVVVRHALRNALIPLITLQGLAFPQLLGGSIVVESIFAWPGIGRLAFESALQRNYTVIMGITVFIGILVIAGNLLADVGYVLTDPRIRYEVT